MSEQIVKMIEAKRDAMEIKCAYLKEIRGDIDTIRKCQVKARVYNELLLEIEGMEIEV